MNCFHQDNSYEIKSKIIQLDVQGIEYMVMLI